MAVGTRYRVHGTGTGYLTCSLRKAAVCMQPIGVADIFVILATTISTALFTSANSPSIAGSENVDVVEAVVRRDEYQYHKSRSVKLVRIVS